MEKTHPDFYDLAAALVAALAAAEAAAEAHDIARMIRKKAIREGNHAAMVEAWLLCDTRWAEWVAARDAARAARAAVRASWLCSPPPAATL